MTSRNTDSSQGEGGNPQHPAGPPDRGHSRGGNKIFKSGPLFLSSKGIGWTSWKKRWFILTRTSLVFFRSDPSAVPQKGSEVNLTLGGIDLNNSGSVVVKAEKKLLTVLFPDGRDGRAFTLKAETLEDLYEWKAALEEALAHSPSATLVMGQNGIFRNDQADAVDGSVEQSKEKQLVKSLVIGRPVLLALEDIDGTPSFLEKALRFVEEHGVKVEGILRQAADVDDVERRIREYEQGKNDFSPGEDAHVIADCVKYFIRELPSSPVPASCCNALLEACRTDRGRRLSAMREAICETFPEPNRRLLQRILMMMQTVASHKAVNRMSSSAVAACMAPLLLRPLLSGDCELEHDFDVGGDGSIQLLQAAAAANHAQAIVITLLEEYDNIFGEGAMSTELYSDSEESGSESEELTDDDETIEDDEYDEDGTDASDVDIDEDFEHASNETHSETGDTGDDELYDDKGSNGPRLISKSNESDDDCKANQKSSSSPPQSSSTQHVNVHITENFPNRNNNSSAMQANVSSEVLGDNHAETSLVHKLTDKSPYKSPSSHVQNSTSISDGPESGGRRPTVWGRTPGKKLAMESVDLPSEDEVEIERLEVTKIDLLDRIAEEASGNENLQASLERRKNASHERRLALEQEVTRLQEQLQKERELRTVLEAGLKMPQGPLPLSATIDEKTKADLEEIARVEADVINLKQKADDLGVQLNQQREQNCGLAHGSCNQPLQTPNHQAKLKEKGKDFETTATSHIPERSTRNKDAQLDKVESDRDMKQDLPFLANKHLPQNQRLDPVCCNKSVGDTTASSCAEPVISKLAPTNSKKSGTWGESCNSKKDPVVIWLTGGPGCSSELAMFYENGPFNIAKNLSLVWNEHGWDKASNLLYVDQPIGTGFSYSSDKRDIRHNEEGVSNDLYDFLQAFFAEHPQFAKNDFYITGESYAGHYIPAFAARVHQGNKAKEGIHINLKGFAIGNGLTNPEIQYRAYTDYALDMGIIKKSDYDRINKVLPVCEMAIKLCGTDGTISCVASYFVCNTIFSSIMLIAGNVNYYDIRKKCDGNLCYDFSNMEEFLKQKNVREALGVGDINFVSCSPTVYQAMLVDWMRNLEVGIPALLQDGIKLLVYAGEYDLICNWLGNSRWVHAMEWAGQKEFVASPEVPFEVDGSEAGVLKSHGPLSFLKVHDAGHMVPMDQPKASLQMLKRWTQGSLSGATAEPENLVSSM